MAQQRKEKIIHIVITLRQIKFITDLSRLDFDGSFSYSKIVEVSTAPLTFSLSQNYPNPFNPVTQIKYSVPEDTYISLKVFNMLGQEVATLFEGLQKTGNYTASFNGSGLASGLYIYQLKANDFVATKKLLLLK